MRSARSCCTPPATCALLLLLAARSASAQQKNVELLRAADAAQLKEVFFSGEPWLVQCGTKADISAAIVDDGFGAHAVVEKAASGLPKEVKVGLLDCHKKLPSGKTTIERFKLDGSISPLLVLAANGKTVQITPSALTKHGLGSTLFPGVRSQAVALASYVKAKSEPKVYQANPNPNPNPDPDPALSRPLALTPTLTLIITLSLTLSLSLTLTLSLSLALTLTLSLTLTLGLSRCTRRRRPSSSRRCVLSGSTVSSCCSTRS